jgi:predicted transposase YdaD
MSEEDKQTIEEVLRVVFAYDETIEDDPVIQHMMAQRELAGKAEGIIEGEARGEIKGLRESILSFLSIRFSPALAAQAQPSIMATQSYDVLKMLFRLLMKAPDEQSALLMLDLPDEQSHLGTSNLPVE